MFRPKYLSSMFWRLLQLQVENLRSVIVCPIWYKIFYFYSHLSVVHVRSCPSPRFFGLSNTWVRCECQSSAAVTTILPSLHPIILPNQPRLANSATRKMKVDLFKVNSEAGKPLSLSVAGSDCNISSQRVTIYQLVVPRVSPWFEK